MAYLSVCLLVVVMSMMSMMAVAMLHGVCALCKW